MDKVLAIKSVSMANRTNSTSDSSLLDSKFSLDKITFLYLMSVPTKVRFAIGLKTSVCLLGSMRTGA